jgi:surfeit locus 1 family protein
MIIVALVSLLIGLGFWQLRRADQKQLILDQQAHQLVRPAIQMHPKTTLLATVRYMPVFMDGMFDCDHQILIDNKIFNRKPGFYVITPFRSSQNNQSILVNRGWIPMKVDRKPDLQYRECLTDILRLHGIANSFPGLGFHFSGSYDSITNNWPQIVLELDAEKLSKDLNYEVVDYLILMDPAMKGGFKRQWSFVPNILPKKHIAYAVQWFGLAISLMVLSFWILRKNKNDN